MVYLFKLREGFKLPIVIDANNIEQAKQFFLNDFVVINIANDKLINTIKNDWEKIKADCCEKCNKYTTVVKDEKTENKFLCSVCYPFPLNEVKK
jgi:protein-arginine kinase activator protein McsA